MELEQPLVSVCMITFNHEAFIEEALIGVLMQNTDFDFELIVANDASTDDTDQIIEQIKDNHIKGSHIRYFNHKENIGMIPNLLFALQQCRGEYIAFCEGDDYWTNPLKLQKQIDVLEANASYSFCGHQSLTKTNDALIQNTIPTGVQKFKDIIQRNFIATSALVFRSEAINKWPEFFKTAKAGDWLLQLLALKSGDAFVLEEVMSVYRKHEDGVWSRKSHYEMGKAGVGLLQLAKQLYTDEKSIALINEAITKREKAYGIRRVSFYGIMMRVYKYFGLSTKSRV